MQQLAFEYDQVSGRGNDQLAVYRDDSRPTFVAQEFRTMVDQMPELSWQPEKSSGGEGSA